jgi:hypothetical protein
MLIVRKLTALLVMSPSISRPSSLAADCAENHITSGTTQQTADTSKEEASSDSLSPATATVPVEWGISTAVEAEQGAVSRHADLAEVPGRHGGAERLRLAHHGRGGHRRLRRHHRHHHRYVRTRLSSMYICNYAYMHAGKELLTPPPITTMQAQRRGSERRRRACWRSAAHCWCCPRGASRRRRRPGRGCAPSARAPTSWCCRWTSARWPPCAASSRASSSSGSRSTSWCM